MADEDNFDDLPPAAELVKERHEAPTGSGSVTPIFQLHHRRTSQETVAMLESLLSDAKRGEVCGLAMVILRSNNGFDIKLRGEAAQVGNQMSVAGMLAALQKMVLELT
jgi:hypothetical protein